MLRTLLIAILAVAAVSIPTGATSAPNATLTGVVGPGFVISLKDEGGARVSHLDPGTYTINVTDNEITHNFHLRGPGVDQGTDIEGASPTPVTWTVTFTDGTYNFQCDAHAAQMKGSFTVGNVPPPPPPATVGKLSGKVTTKAISLTRSGSKVRTLTAGRFKVAVSDTSKTQNFHLKGPGVNRKTGVGARAKASWSLTLKPGKYTYSSDKSRKLRGSFTVKAAG